MKMIPPQSFTYEAGKRAVLLLHGFTGNPADVRKLGRYLHEKGYTCHAPLYTGHGHPAEELLELHPENWWRDAEEGYRLLIAKGYTQIAVVGVSLGAVFALRLGVEYPVTGVVSMCAPIQGKSANELYERVVSYAKSYKTFEGKSPDILQKELQELDQRPREQLSHLQDLISDVGNQLQYLQAPVAVMQGALDQPLYVESAAVIYEKVPDPRKTYTLYPNSGHILTLSPEQQTVFEDTEHFLNTLDWKS